MRAYNNSVVLRNDGVDPSTSAADLNAALGVNITVRVASTPVAGLGALASIFNIAGVAIANPMQTDDKGNYQFKAVDGVYDVVIAEGTADEAIIASEEIIEFDASTNINDLSLTYVFDNVAAYKAFTTVFPVGKIIHLKDRNADFTVIAGTGTANTFNIIASTEVAQSVDLIIGEVADVEQFGAVRATNPSAAINEAAAYCVANGTMLFAKRLNGSPFVLDAALDLFGVKYIQFLSAIDTTAVTGVPAVVIGGFSDSNGMDVEFDRVTDGSSLIAGPTPANPILRVFGASSGSFKLKSCNYLQLYADVAVSGGSSVAYNDFVFDGVVRRVELASNTGFSWVTENNFYGGRTKELKIINGGGYAHNHNQFDNMTFEGDQVEIIMDGCNSNKILNARCENVGSSNGISFLNEAQRNSMEITWSGVTNPRNEFIVSIPIVDNGMGNSVSTKSANDFVQTQIASINAFSGFVASSFDVKAEDPNIAPKDSFGGFNGEVDLDIGLDLLTVGANKWLYLSDLIPVEYGDVVGFDFDTVGDVIRPVVYCYDATQRIQKTNGGGDSYTQPSLALNTTTGAYSPNTDLSPGLLSGAVTRDNIRFIRVGLYSGAGGDFRNLSINIFTPSLGRAATQGAATYKPVGWPVIAGTPTKGWARRGQLVLNYTTNRLHINDVLIETELASTATSGDTSLSLEDGSDTANGDEIGIILNSEKTHWSSIASGGGTNTIVINDAMSSVASSTNRVIFTRWATQSQLP